MPLFFLTMTRSQQKKTGNRLKHMGELRLSVYAPLVAQISRKNYGMVDRLNQAGLYEGISKQNRVLFNGIKMYAAINHHTII